MSARKWLGRLIMLVIFAAASSVLSGCRSGASTSRVPRPMGSDGHIGHTH